MVKRGDHFTLALESTRVFDAVCRAFSEPHWQCGVWHLHDIVPSSLRAALMAYLNRASVRYADDTTKAQLQTTFLRGNFTFKASAQGALWMSRTWTSYSHWRRCFESS